jgi:hypothetical protein
MGKKTIWESRERMRVQDALHFNPSTDLGRLYDANKAGRCEGRSKVEDQDCSRHLTYRWLTNWQA